VRDKKPKAFHKQGLKKRQKTSPIQRGKKKNPKSFAGGNTGGKKGKVLGGKKKICESDRITGGTSQRV